MKKVALVIMALTMVFLCVACGPSAEKKDAVSMQLIVVTNSTMDVEEVSKETVDALKSVDQSVSVDEVEQSEECRYLVTISTTLTEDEVVSALKGADWTQKVQINYELQMY